MGLMGLFLSSLLLAQTTPSQPFSIEGYVEAYFAYDFNMPEHHERPHFLYNFKRHNEFSLNLGLVKLQYQQEQVRANLSVMTGNYAQYNLADEPAWAQMVYEASVGIRLLENLWLDMGVMPSHIGFESAIGMECWHLGRSLMAENSPYFLTGARFTYSYNENLDIILWLTNGWQNVQRTKRNQSLGMGAGVNYRPIEGMVINYANYFGNEYPQTIRLNRFFNNFYWQYQWATYGITVGADLGIEERLFTRNLNKWYGTTISLQKRLWESFRVALRGEYYSDQAAVILEEGMRLSGVSLNVDFEPAKNALLRIEGRRFLSPEPVFERPAGLMSRGNSSIVTSLAIKF